jgi:hypothetical protein
MQFTLQRHTEGFCRGTDKETHESEMMPSNVLRLATVFRLLPQGLHTGHLLGFLDQFDGISDHESPSIKLNSGEKIQTHAGPKAQKVCQAPGIGPEKSQHQLITVRIQEKPPDKATCPQVVKPDHEPGHNDQEPEV